MTVAKQRFGKQRLEAGIVQPKLTSIAEQRLDNYILAATNSNERVLAK
jgi:hypothetical protein